MKYHPHPCPLCGQEALASICCPCGVDLAYLGVPAPDPMATPDQVRVWAAENKVTVFTCGAPKGTPGAKRRDLSLLDAVVAKLDELYCDEPPPAHLAAAHTAFRDMRTRLSAEPAMSTLSDKQRSWVTNIGEQIEADLPPGTPAAQVPRGREVPLLFENKPLPTKPPGRK